MDKRKFEDPKPHKFHNKLLLNVTLLASNEHLSELEEMPVLFMMDEQHRYIDKLITRLRGMLK